MGPEKRIKRTLGPACGHDWPQTGLLLLSVLLLRLPMRVLGDVASDDRDTAAHKARSRKFLNALTASNPLLADFTLGNSRHWSYVDNAMMGRLSLCGRDLGCWFTASCGAGCGGGAKASTSPLSAIGVPPPSFGERHVKNAVRFHVQRRSHQYAPGRVV